MNHSCCFIDGLGVACTFAAEWWIGADPMRHPDDYTEACTLHVGALLGDASPYRIHQIGPGAEVSESDAEVSAPCTHKAVPANTSGEWDRAGKLAGMVYANGTWVEA